MRAVMLLLPFAGLLQADINYSVADLGSLGGPSTVAFAINNSGTAVGWADSPSSDPSAFAAPAGSSLQKLAGLPGSTDSDAYGINSQGTIVGTSYINGQAHGAVWNGSQVSDLGTGVFAMGINDAGAIVGGNGQAFLSQNGNSTDLGVLSGGNWSAAYGINNSGVVVGYGNTGSGAFRGFVWTAGTGMQELGTFGGRSSYAMAVNSSGEVVGQACLLSGYANAFLEVNGVMTDLGTLGGGNSYAYGINDGGEVVGYSNIADGDSHAFLYLNGVMIDLNSLIPADSGWALSEAYGINDAGQIVGEGMYDGQSHAFRLDLDPGPEFGFAAQFAIQPVPEPGTLPMLAAGFGLLVFCARAIKRRA
ncbi:MAG TPA: PEP-CTERM sorting domain-containing protein [Bryobacteraceae bacterium]|nr:PEP-CTERM sorting domain-containing protein [Bryobacteraceae bacterium]